MARKMQYNEDIAWARLQQKTQERSRSKGSPVKLIMLCLGILLVVALGAAAYAPSQQTQLLTLPESVTIHPVIGAAQTPVQVEDVVQGLENTGIQVEIAYDAQILGRQEAVLTFSRGREICTRIVEMYLFHLEPSLTFAQGEEIDLDIRDYVPDETIEAEFVTMPEEGVCGIFELQVLCAGREYTVQYIVTETVAPKGTGKEVTVEADTIPDASAFVENIVDDTPVTVTYKEEPLFIMAGQQRLTLVLTDAFGNTSEVTATANVVPASDGPRFEGLEPVYMQVGSAISYKSGVTATDKQDGTLSFTVEPGDFDNAKEGTYKVLYHTVDSDGNRLTVARTVVVESKTGQKVREKAQVVLNEIIKPGMTRDQQIYAVFRKVWQYVWYSGSSDKSSLENAAYEGFTTWAGDCYTYYAMVKVMLDILEIPNVEVARVGGESRHWWNLVEFEDGKYYHVDATPHRYTNMEHFKMTETVISDYTKDPKIASYRPNYYVYDHTLPQYEGLDIAE
jgi:hypothetical protein